MTHRLQLGPATAPRRALMAAVLGTAPSRTVSALKQHLFDAELTDHPDGLLDLVMVQDYAHFAELLAREGLRLGV